MDSWRGLRRQKRCSIDKATATANTMVLSNAVNDCIVPKLHRSEQNVLVLNKFSLQKLPLEVPLAP